MSRRTWTTLDGWDVAAGWDPPTRSFFFDIGRECEHDDDEDREGEDCQLCHGSGTQYVYSNLEDRTDNVDVMGGIHDLVYVQTLMDRYLTEYPPFAIATLYTDQDLDIANDTKYWGAVGHLRKEVQVG
jgi:hypothetical protein